MDIFSVCFSCLHCGFWNCNSREVKISVKTKVAWFNENIKFGVSSQRFFFSLRQSLVCVCVCVQNTCMPQGVCEGQNTTFGSRFSHYGIQGLNSRPQPCIERAFTCSFISPTLRCLV